MVEIVFDIGTGLVTAEKAEAWAGYGGRVHPKQSLAVLDIATSKLARRFLDKVAEPGQGVTYEKLLCMAQSDPELFELTASLARFKTEAGR